MRLFLLVQLHLEYPTTLVGYVDVWTPRVTCRAPSRGGLPF